MASKLVGVSSPLAFFPLAAEVTIDFEEIIPSQQPHCVTNNLPPLFVAGL
jgi:hypothetical protein